MAQFPALPIWTDAYIADTTDLSAEEHGVYLLLLMAAWRSPDCALPNDDLRLSRMARVGAKKWQKIRPVMLRFFAVSDNGWTQKRLLKEHDRVSKSYSQKVDAGKASALKRKETPSTDVATDEQRTFQQPEPEPEPYNPPVPTVQSPPKQKKAVRLPDDWEPTAVEIDFAKQEGFSENEIIRECGKFRDYWHGVGGQRGTKRNWTATWRNWIRRAADDRGSRPQRGGNGGKRSAILAAAAIGLDRGGREHGEPGDAVANVWDAGSGGSGAGGGGDSGGDGSGKPRGRAEGPDKAAAGDKGAGHGPGRNGDGKRSDFRRTDGFSGGRGAGCVIDVEPDGDIFSAAGGDSGSVSPEDGQSGAPSCGDDAGAGESGRSAVIDLDVLRRMG